jgi:hypothetical protein
MNKVVREEAVCWGTVESWVSEISRSALWDIELRSLIVYSSREYLEDTIVPKGAQKCVSDVVDTEDIRRHEEGTRVRLGWIRKL